MKLLDEVRTALEKGGYDLVESQKGKTLEYPKEVRLRSATDVKVELEPHLFEGEDIKRCLKGFKVSEHNPEIYSREKNKKDNGYYFLIVERSADS